MIIKGSGKGLTLGIRFRGEGLRLGYGLGFRVIGYGQGLSTDQKHTVNRQELPSISRYEM